MYHEWDSIFTIIMISRKNLGYRTLYNDFWFSSFPGFRYVPPGDNPEMVVIYDVNGFIAGMQSIVAKKFIQGPYDFAGSNWYRSDNVLGKAIESRITIQQSHT